MCLVLFTRGSFVFRYFEFVFCLLVELVRLSVSVQADDWKDSSPE